MSTIDTSPLQSSLERLNNAVETLDISLNDVSQLHDGVQQAENVVDVDFMAKRLDRAIETVENLLSEGE